MMSDCLPFPARVGSMNSSVLFCDKDGLRQSRVHRTYAHRENYM